MQKWISLISLCGIVVSCTTKNPTTQAELTPNYTEIDITNEIVYPEFYVISKTLDSIIIDGKSDEEIWHKIPFSKEFIDIEGKTKPQYSTRVKMLWDTSFLYVYAELEEPHIWANLHQRDTVIFYNNDFEIFINPSGDTKKYGEIEVNALNTVWDLYLNKPYRDKGKADNSWDLDQLKSAVNIQGSLNNGKDIDSMWSVEMAIPMNKLIELKNATQMPVDGEQWRINFSRVEWDFTLLNGSYSRKRKDGRYASEYNWVWSNQKVINMHEPEKWGYVQFAEGGDANISAFKQDSLQLAKQIAFALYRLKKKGKMAHLVDSTYGELQKFQARYGSDDLVVVQYQKSPAGFNYQFQDPITKKSIEINQDADLTVENQ